MTEEHTAVILLGVNGVYDKLSHVYDKLPAALNDALIIGQILVAIGTALWFFRRARGAKIDNQRKEQKLKSKK